MRVMRTMSVLAALAGVAGTGNAHHSLAMFDVTRQVELKGTVREFQWTSPHCFIQLLVPSPDGVNEWSIEMHSTITSLRQGWSRNSLKPGDQITVIIHPARAGQHGGMLLSAIDQHGRPVNNRKAPE